MTIRQQSILMGALVTGILSTSYLGFINSICCLGVIIGGIVAAQQYVSRSRTAAPAGEGAVVLSAGDGAVLGALAGAAGSILGTLFDRALRPFGLDSQTIWQGMMEGMMQDMNGQQGLSPEMMQQMQEGGGFGMLLVSLVIGIIVYAIFGAIGGALGAALFGGEREG